MRARRSPTVESDDTSWSEGYEPAADLSFDDAPAPVGRGPMRVCLACGEAPTGRECPHDEVASLDDASPALRGAAAQLAALAQQRRSAERALRRLIDAELMAGRASLSTAAPAQPDAPVLPAPGALATPPLDAAPSKPRRRASVVEEQGFFAFAAPPPPPEPAPAPEPVAAEAGIEAPKRAAKGRRKRVAAEPDVVVE